MCVCADQTGSSLPTAMIYVSCTLTTLPTTSDPASVLVVSTAFQAPADTSATADTATVIRTTKEAVWCQLWTHPRAKKTRKLQGKEEKNGEKIQRGKERAVCYWWSAVLFCEYCYYYLELPWLTKNKKLVIDTAKLNIRSYSLKATFLSRSRFYFNKLFVLIVWRAK